MDLVLRQKFLKQLIKLPVGVQQSFGERSKIFKRNFRDPILNLHALKGDKIGTFSINITGDYRAIFYIEEGMAIFYEIGRHRNLYGK